jgi:hypothetical protein
MGNRLEQLQAWALSPALLRIAGGDLPHPAFAAQCEPLRDDERLRSWDLNLDNARVRDETGGRLSAALWERDVGDGHSFEVVYCAKRGQGGFEFWHVMYADDTDGPDAELIARSEQGLFYWLFFPLIESEFSAHGEGAYSTLAAAAKAVSFEHLVEVFRLQEVIGSDHDRRGEVVTQSLTVE